MNASLRDLNIKASELARRAEAGEVIVITDRGRPIADLGPHRGGVRPAKKAHVLKAFAGLAPVDYQKLLADLDAIADPTAHDPYER